MNEAAGLGDGFGFAAIHDDGEVVGLLGKLIGEGFEQQDHAVVALGVDRFGLKVGVMENLCLFRLEAILNEMVDDALEIVFRRLLAEDLSGFKEAEGGRAQADGDGGGAEAGKASAGHGAFDFDLF